MKRQKHDTQDRLQGSCTKIEFHLVFALSSPLRTLQPSSPFCHNVTYQSIIWFVHSPIWCAPAVYMCVCESHGGWWCRGGTDLDRRGGGGSGRRRRRRRLGGETFTRHSLSEAARVLRRALQGGWFGCGGVKGHARETL